jgi:hypothetical protein
MKANNWLLTKIKDIFETLESSAIQGCQDVTPNLNVYFFQRRINSLRLQLAEELFRVTILAYQRELKAVGKSGFIGL